MVLTLGVDAFEDALPLQVFFVVGIRLPHRSTLFPYTTLFRSDVINLDSGIGFYASLDSLSLVTLKDNNKTPTNGADDNCYMGLQLNDLTSTLIGIDGLTLAVFDAGVKLNQAKDSDTNQANDQPKLGWADLFDDNLGLEPASVPDVDGVDIEVQGSLLLDAFGGVLDEGS